MDRVLDNVKTVSFVRCERHCFMENKCPFKIKREVHGVCFKITKEKGRDKAVWQRPVESGKWVDGDLLHS